MSFKMPKEIMIMGCKYEVLIKRNEEFTDGEWGCIKYKIQQIWINEGLRGDRLINVFLHELVHGYLFAIGKTCENENEELVSCIATIFMEIQKQINN